MAAGPDVVYTVAGFAVVIAIHTVIAVVGVRFLRVRLGTTWAPFVYAVVFLPVVYVPTTVLFSGFLAAGGARISSGTLFTVVFFLPLAMGIAIDIFWLPHPAEVDVPAQEQ